MGQIQLLKILAATLTLLLACNIATAKTDSIELQKMETFHLQNAQDKLSKQQFNYAWGDLAYLLCQIPNHHAALKYMVQIAPLVNKSSELSKFFANALKQYPNDEVVLALYGSFLSNNGEKEQGQQFIAKALAINPKIDQEYLSVIASAPKK